MIKKLAPIIYCLTPLCALADVVTVNGTPGVATVFSGDLNVTTDSYRFVYGSGINVTGGINTTGGFYIGQDAGTNPNVGAVYAESTVDSNYTVTAANAITIGGPLWVESGYNLTIGGAGSAVDLTAGAVDVLGGFTVSNAGAVSFAQFVSTDADATINGASLTIGSGKFQALGAGDTTVNVGAGAFSVANGAIENKSSGDMTITAGAITAQTITNEANVPNSPVGDLTINATSLTLTGGDATTNASFVNKGNFTGVITGATNLAHGFDLGSMGATNTFNLMTGTLSLGDRVAEFYTNNLNSFVLNVTAGGIDAGTNAIRNGITNNNAGMTLIAQTVAAAGIENLATLNITSNGTVNMTGDVTNSGALDISGTTFTMRNISNSGAATLSGSGAFNTDAISNLSGAESLTVSGTAVTASGLITNNAGTMTVEATSGNVGALGLVANAGTMNVTGTTLNVGTSGINVAGTGALNTTGDIVSGGEISVANDLTAGTGVATAGGMSVSGGVVDITINNNEKLSVGNNVTASGSGVGMNIDAHTMDIDGNVSATNSGKLAFSASGGFSVENNLSATNGGEVYLYTNNATVSQAITENSGLIYTTDTNIIAGSVVVQDGLYFDGVTHTNGFVIDSGNTFTLNAAQFTFNGGGNVANGNTLNILRFGDAQSFVNMSGAFTNAGTVNIGASDSRFGSVGLGTLTNDGTFNVWTAGITGGNITNNADGVLNLNSTGNVTLANLTNNGSADVSGVAVALGTVAANSGNSTGGGLRVVGSSSVSANSVSVQSANGALDITAPAVNILGAVSINGGVLHQGTGSTSAMNLLADEFSFKSGAWTMDSFVADGGIGTYDVTGTMNFGTGVFVADGARVNFKRDNMDAPMFSAAGDLVQNVSGTTRDGTVNMMSNNFTLNANNVEIGGDINVTNFTIANLNAANGMNIDVTGDVLGNLGIMGLGHMTVGGNYIFDDNSKLLAIANAASAEYNYWTDVDFSGVEPVINPLTGGESALITVGGTLTNATSGLNVTDTPTDLDNSQFGIVLRQAVTESSALWLAHADAIDGLYFNRLSVGFCNSDGTSCVNYLDAFDTFNNTDENLPVYLVTVDNDLYVVFDTRFGEPIGLFKLQPVVGATPGHTLGEWQSAGALDDVIEAALANLGYNYETAILPVVRVLFDGTPLERVDSELYARMYDYSQNGNGNVIRAFSRLFQLREANQIADSLVLNTHTNFRDMADRFIDEAIWNRNRRLNKLWVDGSYGMFTNDFGDIRGDGNRFNLSMGYDWQANDTLILGWMVHGSYTDANVDDDIDLGYGDMGRIAGRMESNMTNLSVGGGLYFLDTLSNKMRLYGDAMIDINMIDVERNQTWVDTIKGDATSFGAVAEFGLIHDWLNQYVIGNLYVRGGYNFGFDMTEKVGDTDYMNLEFDGYPILTPGYSLTAQKRVYPSAWFEFRPYATVGIEYDLLGSPDTMQYKFAMANKWTDYNIDVDPLWANAGAGVEFLWVNGLHIGAGYRYQYNADVQMHKIHASMKYRF